MPRILTNEVTIVDLTLPRTVTVVVRDLLNALPRLCRFTGHLREEVEDYSVAQHMCLVHDLLLHHRPAEESLRQYGLIHDAHEAYVGDVSSPVKRALRELQDEDQEGNRLLPQNYSCFDKLEHNHERVVHRRFDLPWPPPRDFLDAVKLADLWALYLEHRDLREPQVDGPVLVHGQAPPHAGLYPTIEPWSRRRARAELLERLLRYWTAEFLGLDTTYVRAALALGSYPTQLRPPESGRWGLVSGAPDYDVLADEYWAAVRIIGQQRQQIEQLKQDIERSPTSRSPQPAGGESNY